MYEIVLKVLKVCPKGSMIIQEGEDAIDVEIMQKGEL